METKTGWKTSEFWLSIAAVLVSVFLSIEAAGDSLGWLGRAAELLATVLVALGYTVSRTLVKRSDSALSAAKALSANPPPADE